MIRLSFTVLSDSGRPMVTIKMFHSPTGGDVPIAKEISTIFARRNLVVALGDQISRLRTVHELPEVAHALEMFRRFCSEYQHLGISSLPPIREKNKSGILIMSFPFRFGAETAERTLPADNAPSWAQAGCQDPWGDKT